MENYHRLPISPERPSSSTSINYINSTPQPPFPVRPLPHPRANTNAIPGPSHHHQHQHQQQQQQQQQQQGGGGSASSGRYPSSLSAEEIRRNPSSINGSTSQGVNPAMYRGVHIRDGSGGSITSPPGRAHSPLPPTRTINNPPQQQQQYYSHPQQYQTQPTPLSVHPSSLPHPQSQSQSHTPVPSSSRSQIPLPQGTFCTATSDHESLSVVPLAGLISVAAIKERILSKLHIGDDEFFSCSFFLTRIGGGEGRRINDDDELWESCWLAGTEGKPITIFVKQSTNETSPHLTQLEDFGNSAQTMSRYRDRDDRSSLGGGVPSPTSAAVAATTNNIANLRRSSNNRSPSNSSRSDISSHLGHVMLENGEFSPVGGPDRRGSWLPQSSASIAGGGGAHRGGSQSGSPENMSGGLGIIGGGGGSLSPPIDSRGRSSQGSLTPTAPVAEDYWSEQQAHQLQLQHLQQSRRPSAPAAMMSNNNNNQQQQPPLPPPSRILPNIGVRGSSSRNQSPHDEQRRTQTIPPPTLSSSSSSLKNWQQRPSSTYQQQQQIPSQFAGRPPPAADPRTHHPQYQYSSVPSPSSEYHNLSFQSNNYQQQQQQQLQQQQSAPSQPIHPAYANYGHYSPNLQPQLTFSNVPLSVTQGGGSRIITGSKSSDNLRSYPPTFVESDQRPPIPGPIPPQYLIRPHSVYPSTSSTRTSTSTPGLPRPPPRPPTPPNPPLSSTTSQSYQPFDPRVMRPSINTNTTNNSTTTSSQMYPHSNLYPYPTPPPPPSLHQRPPPPPPSSSSSSPPVIRRSSQDPRLVLQPQPEIPYIPDLSSVRPGEILQSQQPIRRQSDGSSIISTTTTNNNTNSSTIKPPAATLMRVIDPTLSMNQERKRLNSSGNSPLIGNGTGFDLVSGGFESGERYPVGISSSGSAIIADGNSRKDSGGSSVGTTEGGRKVSSDSSRIIRDGNLSPVAGGRERERERDRPSPRDSGSSFASGSTSPTSRQRHHNLPALTPSIPPTSTSNANTNDETAYGGLEDERNYQRSSTSSARSSTASGGPLTPATDSIAPAVQDLQQSQARQLSITSSSSSIINVPTYSDGFDDPIEDDSTWFPINQPMKSQTMSPPPISVILNLNSPTSPTPLQINPPLLSLHSPGGLHLLEPSPEEAGSGTIRAHDWAESCLSSFPKEGEDTITNVSNPVPAFTTSTPTPTLISIDTKVVPTLGEKLGSFVEDPAFYFPEKNLNTYPTTNEFDDDEETSTYLPGFGPSTPRLAPAPVPSTPQAFNSPTSPVGVSLRDEPSSRSPILDRHNKEKRPTLTLVTSEPVPLSSSTSSPNNVKLPDSTPSSTSSVLSSIPTPTSRTPSNLIALASSTPSTTPSPSIQTRQSPRRQEQRIRPSPGSKRLSELSLSQIDLEGADSPIGRHNSFAAREKDWAFRPPVETVLEHLEDFFPEHDLDKPIFDAPPTPLPGTNLESLTVTPPSSSSTTATTPTTPSSPKPEEILKRNSGAIGLKYKKSIRHVAQNQRKSLLKAGAVASRGGGLTNNGHHEHKGSYSSVLRRKSTKLFGNRLEEVTARQIKQMEEPILENSNLEDPENFSFKWIKGELIGRGTFGHVYLAYNITAAEFIAVKQVELPKTRSDQADLRQQGMVASLKAEIELLKDLEHPKIVEYLGMEETIEHLSIFLEYVPGGSVGRIVRTHGKFEENIIKSFTYQILEGLEYLHSLGILHRDLKADNILCDHQGRCKISDFGTSKRSNDIYNNNANMSMQGSIFWMAPEVIKNFKQGQGYSAKADIWSLGCVCLEMFAGRRPWSDDEAIQAMFKLGSERIPPPIPADVTLSKSASHFLGNCLSIDSEMRPRASQLMRHSFLALPDQWSFLETSLYRAIAASGDELSFQ